MRACWWVTGGLACTGSTTVDVGVTDTEDSTTVPTSATGSDTGTQAGADPRLRALHVGATLPAQDMFGNGNAGQPPLVDLDFGEAWPGGQAWATRPANDYTFTFLDDGAKAPWTEFDYTLEADHFYSMIVMGTLKDRQVLATDDAVAEVPGDRVRMRWTHAAPSLSGVSLQLLDALVDVQYGGGATLGYGDSVESDEAMGAVNLWIDLDGDSGCDLGEVFAPFERAPGDYFHVLVIDDPVGELVLQGHTATGQAPMRALAKECP